MPENKKIKSPGDGYKLVSSVDIENSPLKDRLDRNQQGLFDDKDSIQEGPGEGYKLLSDKEAAERLNTSSAKKPKPTMTRWKGLTEIPPRTGDAQADEALSMLMDGPIYNEDDIDHETFLRKTDPKLLRKNEYFVPDRKEWEPLPIQQAKKEIAVIDRQKADLEKQFRRINEVSEWTKATDSTTPGTEVGKPSGRTVDQFEDLRPEELIDIYGTVNPENLSQKEKRQAEHHYMNRLPGELKSQIKELKRKTVDITDQTAGYNYASELLALEQELESVKNLNTIREQRREWITGEEDPSKGMSAPFKKQFNTLQQIGRRLAHLATKGGFGTPGIPYMGPENENRVIKDMSEQILSEIGALEGQRQQIANSLRSEDPKVKKELNQNDPVINPNAKFNTIDLKNQHGEEAVRRNRLNHFEEVIDNQMLSNNVSLKESEGNKHILDFEYFLSPDFKKGFDFMDSGKFATAETIMKSVKNMNSYYDADIKGKQNIIYSAVKRYAANNSETTEARDKLEKEILPYLLYGMLYTDEGNLSFTGVQMYAQNTLDKFNLYKKELSVQRAQIQSKASKSDPQSLEQMVDYGRDIERELAITHLSIENMEKLLKMNPDESGLRKLGHGLTSVPAHELLSLGITEMGEMLGISKLANDVSKGYIPSYAEQKSLEAYTLANMANSSGEKLGWYRVGQGITKMVPYIAMFGATSGAGSAAKKGTEIGVKRAVKATAGPKLYGKIANSAQFKLSPVGKKIVGTTKDAISIPELAVKGIGYTTGAAGQSLLMFPMYTRSIAESQTPNIELTFGDGIDDMMIAIDGNTTPMGQSIKSAAIETFSEVFSERFGPHIMKTFGIAGRTTKYAATGAVNEPAKRFLATRLAGVKSRMSPGVKDANTFIRKGLGWHSVPEEYFEELLNYHMVAGLEGNEITYDKQFFQEQLETLGIVAIFGMGMGSINMPAAIQEIKYGEGVLFKYQDYKRHYDGGILLDSEGNPVTETKGVTLPEDIHKEFKEALLSEDENFGDKVHAVLWKNRGKLSKEQKGLMFKLIAQEQVNRIMQESLPEDFKKLSKKQQKQERETARAKAEYENNADFNHYMMEKRRNEHLLDNHDKKQKALEKSLAENKISQQEFDREVEKANQQLKKDMGLEEEVVEGKEEKGKETPAKMEYEEGVTEHTKELQLSQEEAQKIEEQNQKIVDQYPDLYEEGLLERDPGGQFIEPNKYDLARKAKELTMELSKSTRKDQAGRTIIDNESHIDLTNKIAALESELRKKLGMSAGSFNDMLTPHKFEMVFSEVMAGKELKGRMQKPSYSITGFEVVLEDGRMVKAFQDERDNKKVLEKFNSAINNNEKVSLNIIPKSEWNADNKEGYIENGMFIPYGDKVAVTLEDGTVVGSLALRFQDEMKERQKRYDEITRKEQMHLDNAMKYFGIRKPTSQAVEHGEPIKPNLQKGLEELAMYIVELMKRTGMDIEQALAKLRSAVAKSNRENKDFYAESLEKYEDQVVSKAFEIIEQQNKEKAEAAAEKAAFTFAPKKGNEKEGDVLNEIGEPAGDPKDSQTLTQEQRMLNNLKKFSPLWEAIAGVADTSRDNVELAFYRMAKDPRWLEIKTQEDYNAFIISFRSSAPAFSVAEDISLRNHIVDVITQIPFDAVRSVFQFYSNVTLTKNMNVILSKGKVKINSANASGRYPILLEKFMSHLDKIDMQQTKHIILKNNNIAYNFQRNEFVDATDKQKTEFRFRKHEEDLQILQSITGIPADTWREYFEYKENAEIKDVPVNKQGTSKFTFENYDALMSQDTYRKGYPRLQSNLMFSLQQQQELQNATTDQQIRDALIKFFTKGYGSIKSNLFKLATSLEDDISLYGIDVKNDRFSSLEMSSHLSETAHNIRQDKRPSKLRDYYRTLDKDAQIVYIKGIVDYDNNQDTSGHDPSRMTANDIFFTLMQFYAEKDNYQQHLGQFADKDRIATIEVPKHRDPTAEEIADLKEIFPDFDGAVDHIYKILLRPPYMDYFLNYDNGVLKGPAAGYEGNFNQKLKNFAKEFTYNYAIWIRDINNVFHGDLAQYGGLTNMIKRGGVLNSPGMIPHQNIEGGVGKDYRVLVIDDKRPGLFETEEVLDGFSFMSGSFAQKIATSIGSVFSKTDEFGIFDSVKAAHSGINPENGLRSLMKTNNVNIDIFDDTYGKSPLIDMIRKLMKKHNVDIVTFTSGNKQVEIEEYEAPKLYNKDGSMNLKMKVSKNHVITRETGSLFIQQDLRHSARPVVRAMLSQLPTNLYNLKFSDQFQRIMDSIRDASYLEFQNSLKDKTIEEIRLEILKAKADKHSNPHLARMLEKGFDGMEPGMRKFAEIIFASNVGKRIMEIPVNRVTTQEIPDFDKKLKGLRPSKSNPTKNLLPEIATNLPGGRAYNDYYKGFPEKAIQHVRANKEKYQDLFDENGELMAWEIIDAGGAIPGEYVVSNRVPGDDLHAHVVGRLKYNLSTGNFTMLDAVSRLIGGSDFDGDARFNQVLFKTKNGHIKMDNDSKEGLANQYIKYMALSYMEKDAQDRISSPIDTKAYDPIIKKLVQPEQFKSVDLRAYAESWKMNILGQKMKGIMTHLNTAFSIAEQMKLPLNDISVPWKSGKKMTRVVNDHWGVIKTHISNFQNMAFDNGKDPKIEILALNEITANMYILAIIGDPALDSRGDKFKNADQHYDAVNKAVEENAKYFTSKLVRRFVELVRDKNAGIGSSLMTDVWRKLKESGFSKQHIKDLKNFYNKAENLYAIRQLYNYTQKAPITPTETIELGYLIRKFQDNDYSLFDSSAFFDSQGRFTGPFKHVHTSYDTALQYMFRDAPELSQTGQNILSEIERKYPLFASQTKSFLTKAELELFSKHLNNLIAVRAMNPTDAFFEVSRKAIDALRRYQTINPTNKFISKLQISHPIKKGTFQEDTTKPLEISTAPDFRDVDINDYELKQIHEDFASIPEELKDILTAYAFHKYGTSNARQNGGFYFFMDDTHKNEVSKKFMAETEALSTDVYEPHVLQKMVHYIINASETDRFKQLWDNGRKEKLTGNDVNALITSYFPISFFALRTLTEVNTKASWAAWQEKFGGNGAFLKRLAEELKVGKITSVMNQVLPWAKDLYQKELRVSEKFYPFIPRDEQVQDQEAQKEIIEPAQIKEGVSEVFEQNPELVTIGTPQQYSEYLQSIFPESQVQDIVYHETAKYSKDKILEKGFAEPIEEKLDHTKDSLIWFSKKRNYYNAKNTVSIPVILNTVNPHIDSHENFERVGDASAIRSYNLQGFDAIVTEQFSTEDISPEAYSEGSAFKNPIVFVAVAKSEQIHILGSKQDIQGFKEFIGQEGATTAEPKVDLSIPWKNGLDTRPVFTPEGINTMRTSGREAEHKHFGNPFSEAGYGNTIKVLSVDMAVELYGRWLQGESFAFSDMNDKVHNTAYINNEQRDWILEQINSGKLDNANLLYDKKLHKRGLGSHADELAKVIKDLRTEEEPTQKGPIQGIDRGTLSEDVIQDMAMQDSITEALLSSDEPFQNFILTELHNLYPTIEFFQDRNAFYDFVLDHGGSLMDVSMTSIGHAFKNAAFIDPESAVQSTPIHETAHIYWRALPKDDATKQELLSMYRKIPGNKDLHEGIITEQIILDIGRTGVDRADLMWKGNSLARFMDLLKRFWIKVKKALGVYSSKDLISEMAYRVLTNKDKIKPTTAMSRSALVNMVVPHDQSFDDMLSEKPGSSVRIGNIDFQSVTNIIKDLQAEPFNEALQAQQAATKKQKEFELEYGIPLPEGDFRREIETTKLKWERMGLRGTAIHAVIAEVFGADPVMDNYINENFERGAYKKLRSSMIDLKQAILFRYPEAQFFPEHRVYSLDHKVSGIIDLKVNIGENKVIIFDFKTTDKPFVEENEKDEKVLADHYTKQHGPMKSPLAEGVLHSKKLEHELQLGIYAAILEEMGESVEELYINPIIREMGEDGRVSKAEPADMIGIESPDQMEITPDIWGNMVKVKWKGKDGQHIPGFRDRIVEILKKHSISEEKLNEQSVQYESTMINNGVFPTVAHTMAVADKYFRRLVPHGALNNFTYRHLEPRLNGGVGITGMMARLSQLGFERDDMRGPNAMSTEELFYAFYKNKEKKDLIQNKASYFPVIPVMSKYIQTPNSKHNPNKPFYYKKVYDSPRKEGQAPEGDPVEYRMREIGGDLIEKGQKIVEFAKFKFSDGKVKEYANVYEVVAVNQKYQFIFVRDVNSEDGHMTKRDIVRDDAGFLQLLNKFPEKHNLTEEYFEPAFNLEKEDVREAHMKRLTLSDFGNNEEEFQSYELNMPKIDQFFNQYDTLEKLRVFTDNENAVNDFLGKIRFMLGVDNKNTQVTAIYNMLAAVSTAHIYAKYIRLESKSGLKHVRPMTLNAFHDITNNRDALPKNMSTSAIQKALGNPRMQNAKNVRFHTVTNGVEYAWRFAQAEQIEFRDKINEYISGKLFNLLPGDKMDFSRLVTNQYGTNIYKRPSDKSLSQMEKDFLELVYSYHYKYNPRYNQLKRSTENPYPDRIRVASIFMGKQEIKQAYGGFEGALWGPATHRLLQPTSYDHIPVPVMDIVDGQLKPTGEVMTLKEIKDNFVIEKGNSKMRQKYLGSATFGLPLRQLLSSFNGLKGIVSLFGKAKMGLLEYYDQQAREKYQASYSAGGVMARLKKSSVPSVGQNKVAHETKFKLEGEAKSIESLIFKHYMKDIIPVKDYMNFTHHEKTNIQDYLDTYTDAIIYKQKPGVIGEDTALAQLIDGWMQLTSLNKIAWQMHVQVKNLAIGLSTNMVVEPVVFARGVARVGLLFNDIFSFHKITKADLKKLKPNIFDGKVLHLMRKFNVVTAADQPKFDTMEKRMRIGLGGKVRPSLYGTFINLGYKPMEIAETIIQMYVFAGSMTKEEWNAYDKNGNLKPGEFKNRITSARAGQIHDLIKSLHGDYTPIFAAPAWLGHGGAMFLQFRKWYPAMAQRWIAPYHFDRNYDLKAGVISTVALLGLIFHYDTKSSRKRKADFERISNDYQTNPNKHLDFHFFSKLIDYMDYLIKESEGGRIKLKDLSKRDINNLRHFLFTLTSQIAARMVMAIIEAQGDDDWEFESDDIWDVIQDYLQIFSRQVFAVVSLEENQQLLESPLPLLAIPQNIARIVQHVFFAIRGDERAFYDRDTPYGLKGQSKLWLMLTHIFPVGSEMRRRIKKRNIKKLKKTPVNYELLGVPEEKVQELRDAFMNTIKDSPKREKGKIDELSKYDVMIINNERKRAENLANRGVKAKEIVDWMKKEGMLGENPTEEVLKGSLTEALLFMEKQRIVEQELSNFNKAYEYMVSLPEIKKKEEAIEEITSWAKIEREAMDDAESMSRYKKLKVANRFARKAMKNLDVKDHDQLRLIMEGTIYEK